MSWICTNRQAQRSYFVELGSFVSVLDLMHNHDGREVVPERGTLVGVMVDLAELRLALSDVRRLNIRFLLHDVNGACASRHHCR